MTPPEPLWRTLVRLRWPLALAVGLAFAAAQALETLLLGRPEPPAWLAADVVIWALLGALVVAGVLTWVSRRERRYQHDLEAALDEQRALNERLARANGQLELLSAVNRAIAESASLDEVLDAAVSLPARLVPTVGAALVLADAAGPVDARVTGLSANELAHRRAAAGITPELAADRAPRLLPPRSEPRPAGCLLVPLHDGLAPVGWLELYLAPGAAPADDELALLETIGGEVAEAVVSERRRSREATAVYALDRAVTEERARIARDIHDGLAQDLAFLRLRLELWRAWVGDDPERVRDEMAAMKGTLRDQIGELRRAIFALRPVPFEVLGFVAGLRRYIDEFAGQYDWDAQVDLSGAPSDLAPELEATVFRVVQEALTNVAKHAMARRVDVCVARADGGLAVVVRDDGRGFAPGDLAEAPAGRVGLRQMEERLNALRGRLTVLSQPGGPTELRAWMPMPAPGP